MLELIYDLTDGGGGCLHSAPRVFKKKKKAEMWRCLKFVSIWGIDLFYLRGKIKKHTHFPMVTFSFISSYRCSLRIFPSPHSCVLSIQLQISTQPPLSISFASLSHQTVLSTVPSYSLTQLALSLPHTHTSALLTLCSFTSIHSFILSYFFFISHSTHMDTYTHTHMCTHAHMHAHPHNAHTRTHKHTHVHTHAT